MSESIWHIKNLTLDGVNKSMENTMVDHLGIQVIEIGNDFLEGTMPIDHRTVQPQRRLHGGASCVLAETLGSLAANLTLDSDKKIAFGQSINTSHLRPGTHGPVRGRAIPIHLGRSSQVWEIKSWDSRDKLISISRLTLTVVSK